MKEKDKKNQVVTPEPPQVMDPSKLPNQQAKNRKDAPAKPKGKKRTGDKPEARPRPLGNR